MTEALSYATKLSIATTVFEFITCDIKETRDLLDDEDGLRGTRTRHLERAAQGLIHIGGSIKMNPTPLELKTLWPLIVQSGSGDTLTDAMQDFTLVKDTVTASETYSGRFTKATFGGGPGKKMELTLQFVGYSCTMGSGGSISGQGDVTNRPYMFMDSGSGITIGGTTYSFDEFELEIDNHIDPTFMQGQTATDLQPTDREVNLKIRTKYTATEAALLTAAQAGPVLGSPVSASIAFANGSNSASFALPALVAKSETVGITDKKKLRLPLAYRCYGVGSNLEIVATFV